MNDNFILHGIAAVIYICIFMHLLVTDQKLEALKTQVTICESAIKGTK